MRAFERAFFDYYYHKKNWYSALDKLPHRSTIAWAVGPVLDAEILMYKATDDPLYLNRAIDQIDKVIRLREDKLGRKLHNGESPPIWAGGNRYGFAEEKLQNVAGEDVLSVLAYGDWTGGAQPPLRMRNDSTYLEIAEGSTPGTFKIIVENQQRSHFYREYDHLSLNREGVISDDGNIRITVLKPGALSPNDNPPPRGRRLIANSLDYLFETVGLLCKSMLEVVKITKDQQLSSYYAHKSSDYVKIVREAVDHYIKVFWRDFGETGIFVGSAERFSSPSNAPIPYNKCWEFVGVLVLLYQITEDKRYLSIIRKYAKYFKDRIELDSTKNLYLWKYWAWEGYPNLVTSHYAKLDLEGIFSVYQLGEIFTLEDMQRFTRTYTENIFLPFDGYANTVAGTGTESRKYQPGYVNMFSIFDRRMFTKPLFWIEERAYVYNQDYLKAIARTVYQKRILEPEYVDPTDTRKKGVYRTGNSALRIREQETRMVSLVAREQSPLKVMTSEGVQGIELAENDGAEGLKITTTKGIKKLKYV
ncbi:hypothetical protein [Caldalkalibacillus mannanilyticus]|uniref:hypothetical protein n=1 Tax=Caldalkalibacillus mannanilyticus TaxID=1418 RepID=UPI000468D558|nr:hypothetical protein [Caldalkalibacillus mannanilyticus]